MAGMREDKKPDVEGVAVVSSLAMEKRLRWFQGVPRYAWIVLMLAALGWLFDAMDQNLFTLVRQQSVLDLLKNSHILAADLDATAKSTGGLLTAVFLIGWAVGGLVFGVVGDRLGRTRTMIVTILIYAIFTGFNAFAQNIWQYGACRFFTALGVGGEFAAGAALVAEVWPERSRPMALGMLQSFSALGNMAAALISFFLSALSWRYVYVVGALPALLVVLIRASVKEPERWVRAREIAEADGTHRELGNIKELWSNAVLRRNTIAGVLIALAGVGGLWGISFFLVDLVGSTLKPMVKQLPEVLAQPHAAQAAAVTATLQAYRSKVFFVQQVGALLGMYVYAALSEKTGRRPALALFFVLAFFAVQMAFRGIHDVFSAYLLSFPLGFCALAPFSAFAVYFPELYPTRLRATGVGICYNGARILAAFAPFILGNLARAFASASDETAGLRTAASIVAGVYIFGLIGLSLSPETKGKPLPE